MPAELCQRIAGLAMQFEFDDVMKLLTFVLAIGVQTWAIVAFLMRRQDEHRAALEKKIDEHKKEAVTDSGALHNRINEVKDSYVKRSDLDREFTNLQKNMSDMKLDFHTALVGINQRMDQMLTLISKWSPNGANR